jgi:hypothetical protein
MLPRFHVIMLVLTLAALGGCAGPLNNEPGIGNAGRTFGHSIYTPATLAEGLPPQPGPGLAPTVDQAAAPIYEAGGAATPETFHPSLLGLDRENWTIERVDVPNDFPAHQPRLARDYIIKSSDPRAQGRFPDERTALGTTTTRHANEQVVEALAAPFVAAQNIVMMVPRAVVEMRPWQPTRTGGEGYIRSRQQVTIVNPAAEAEGTPHRVDQTSAPRAQPSRRKVPPAAPNPPGARSVPAEIPTTPGEELRPGGGMPASDTPNQP